MALGALCAVAIGAGGVLSGTASAAAATWRTIAADEFERTTPSGWGSAPTGGAWSVLSGGQALSVANGAGQVRDLPSGVSATAALAATRATDVRASYEATFPNAGSGAWTAFEGVQIRRQTDGTSYRVRARVTADGRVAVSATRTAPRSETALGSVDVPVKATPSVPIALRFEVTGTDPVQIRGKAWAAGTTEPAWQLGVTDGSSSRITAPGAATVWTHAGTGAAVTTRIDHLKFATSDPAATPPASSTPVSTPASTRPTAPSSTAAATPASTAVPVTSAPASSVPVSTTATVPTAASSVSPQAGSTSQSVPPPSLIPATSSQEAAPTTVATTAPPVPETTEAPTTASPTTTAAPSTTAGPTTTAGGGTTGNGKPDASTTGVPAGTSLTRYDGPLTITTPGTVIENKEVFGDLRIQARDVVIRNSYLHCGIGHPTSNTGCIDANHWDVYNLLVENNTINPDSPSYFRDGIVGHEFTARGNHITRTNDGIGIFNRPGGAWQANVTVTGNYIHDLTHWNYDPAHSDGTHNDGIEIQGGQNIYIAGNNIVGSVVAGDGLGVFGLHGGAALLVTQNVTKVDNLVIEKNWFDDAQNSVCVQHGKWPDVTVTLRENWFGRNQFQYPRNSTYQIRIYSESQDRVLGLLTNRWEDTNGLLTVGRDTGIRYNGA